MKKGNGPRKIVEPDNLKPNSMREAWDKLKNADYKGGFKTFVRNIYTPTNMKYIPPLKAIDEVFGPAKNASKHAAKRASAIASITSQFPPQHEFGKFDKEGVARYIKNKVSNVYGDSDYEDEFYKDFDDKDYAMDKHGPIRSDTEQAAHEGSWTGLDSAIPGGLWPAEQSMQGAKSGAQPKKSSRIEPGHLAGFGGYTGRDTSANKLKASSRGGDVGSFMSDWYKPEKGTGSDFDPTSQSEGKLSSAPTFGESYAEKPSRLYPKVEFPYAQYSEKEKGYPMIKRQLRGIGNIESANARVPKFALPENELFNPSKYTTMNVPRNVEQRGLPTNSSISKDEYEPPDSKFFDKAVSELWEISKSNSNNGCSIEFSVSEKARNNPKAIDALPDVFKSYNAMILDRIKVRR